MNHVLSIEAPDTLNTSILRIIDTSIYHTQLKVKCKRLEITVPGFLKPVFFEDDVLEQNFTANLTSEDLKISNHDCNDVTSPLPDGIYIIKYSVSPNKQVYVEYNHLRTSAIMNRYHKALCSVKLFDQEPNRDADAKLKLLYQIRMYIDAAKAQVEIRHDADKGMQLYSYASKLLEKFNCVESC